MLCWCKRFMSGVKNVTTAIEVNAAVAGMKLQCWCSHVNNVELLDVDSVLLRYLTEFNIVYI